MPVFTISAALAVIRPLISTIRQRSRQLREANDLCARLNQRLNDVTEELEIVSDREERQMPHLLTLIREYLEAVTAFSERSNFAVRVLTVESFVKKIRTYNERLDDIISMITVRQMMITLQWRAQYEEDKMTIINTFNNLTHLEERMFGSLQQLSAVTAVLEGLVLVAKRNVGDVSDRLNWENTPQPLAPAYNYLVNVAQNDILHRDVDIPPTWLIAADEVTTSNNIVKTRFFEIFNGKWQGANVDVKILREIGKNSPVFDEYLKIWSTLRHPNVSQLYGAGTKDGAPFFVYENTSKSLDRCRGSFSEKQLWGLLHQAALGLSYLHNKRIIHGNLSCSKLLVTDQGIVKLSGFGASYIREERARSLSLKPDICEDFAAPECFNTSAELSRNPGFESDVYSFGLTIIQAISLNGPFGDLLPEQFRTRKLNNQLPQPEDMIGGKWHLVEQMCLFNQEQRPSLAFITDQLEQFSKLDEDAVSAETMSD